MDEYSRHMIPNPAFSPEDFPRAVPLDIRRGQRLFEDGDAFDGSAYLLTHGFVDVLIRGLDGSETMLYRLKETVLVGELGFIEGERSCRSATVVAATPCRVLRILASDWRHASQQPGFEAKLYQSIYHRFQMTHRVVRRLGQSRVIHRLGIYLMNLEAWEQSADDILEVRLPTHATLASMLTCTRERVTRLLKTLVAAGALEKLPGQGRFRIHRARLIETLNIGE